MQTITDIYKSYKTETTNPVDKALFKEICETFNILLIDNLLLEGKSFNMKHNLSNISIRRIERNPSSPTIDWWESNKYKQELQKVHSFMIQNQGKVRNGLFTTLIPGTVNIIGKKVNVESQIKLLIDLPLPEELKVTKKN